MRVREDNPFRKFRNELGLSQTAFGKNAGVSKHAILRLEQGMYDKPLPSVVEYVTSISDLTHYQLSEQYAHYQRAVRNEEPMIFGSMNLRLQSCPRKVHPLTYLRELQNLNQTELCKRLCISQTVINNFELKWQTQHTVPKQLLDALRDNGYGSIDLTALEDWYEAFRRSQLDQHQVRLINERDRNSGTPTNTVRDKPSFVSGSTVPTDGDVALSGTGV